MDIGGIKGMKVVCKNCGRPANSSEFSLDPYYRMMVCPQCVKDRRMRDSVHKELKEMKEQKKKKADEEEGKMEVVKAPGWDAEDEHLEKAYKMKMKRTVQVESVGGDKVKYSCPKCKYAFIFDTATKKPNRCPYCGGNILNIRY